MGCGKGRPMERTLNPPLDRKGRSYHDGLFLPERQYLEECCVHGWELLLYGGVWGFCPFPGWDRILGVFSPSMVSATASDLQTPSGVTGTADPNGSPPLETLELGSASPVCLPSLKGPCCSEIHSHTCRLFPSWYKGGRHCARWGVKVFQNPKSPRRLTPL